MTVSNNKEVYSRQICLFFVAFLPPLKLFFMPSALSTVFDNDVWLCAVFSFIIDFSCLQITLFLSKKYDCDFYTLISQTFGNVFAKLVYSLYAVMLFMRAVIPVFELCYFVKLTLYEAVATDFYFFPFFVLPVYLSTLSLRSLGRLGELLCYFTILGLIILLAMSVSNVKLFNLLPIGISFPKNILTNFQKPFVWFGDSVYMLFFMGEAKLKKNDRTKISLSFLIAYLSVVIFLIFFYSIFMTTSIRQTFSLSEISKYSTSINSTARFDYLGVFCILFVNVISASLPIFFGAKALKKAYDVKPVYSSLFFIILLMIFLMFFKQYLLSVINFILDYFSYFMFFMTIFPVFIFLPLRIKDKKIGLPIKEKYNEVY